ncbi:MAG: hypothetical protein JNK07_11200 [Alphaproteobacteria bacterium]|nr:hypothetical protein [Alphaproteobacteria bacterium]
MDVRLNRREFGLGLLGAALVPPAFAAAAYRGPNVVIIRYGGGVRRKETIDPLYSYSPYLAKVLIPQGTLYPLMRIEGREGIVTSHAEGTLYILTGRYDRYKDVTGQFLRDRFEPKVPTLFEYLRAAHGVADHEALIVNGENRMDEDFLTYSTDPHYGVRYRSTVLSLHQFKAHLLRRKIAAGEFDGEALTKAKAELREREALDLRRESVTNSPRIESFWDDWRRDYGDSGLKNPRGDRMLTALALRAMKELKPKLMLVNYQDPDYVHWGNASHYTRAISVIDEGIRQIVTAVEADPIYRDDTVFVVVPDCGRDDNALMRVPYQHHFGSKASHEIWALVFGRGIARGAVIDKPVEQIAIARTVGRLMGFDAGAAEGGVLEEVFA